MGEGCDGVGSLFFGEDKGGDCKDDYFTVSSVSFLPH